MKQENQKTAIVIGIIAIIFIFFFLPKLNLFSILPPGQCNFKSDGSFITNVNYGALEEVPNYYNAQASWISVDFNQDGKLETFGDSQYTYGNVTLIACESKQVITTTPAGYKLVLWENNKIGICNPVGDYVATYTLNTNNTVAATKLSECTNYVPPAVTINITVNVTTNNTACTQDAKLCPDGSYVGRNPNANCAFYSCPTNITLNQTNQNTFNQTNNQTANNSTTSSDFFSAEAFKIGEFSIKLWMILAIVLLIIFAWLFKQ